MCHGGKPIEYFFVKWQPEDAEQLDVEPANTKHQTFWEFITLLLALVQWGDCFVSEAVAVLGDNTGALQKSLALRGRGPLLAIARELAWRKAQRRWAYEVGHLPSEHNTRADALSRQFGSEREPFPRQLTRARRVFPAPVRSLWKLRD